MFHYPCPLVSNVLALPIVPVLLSEFILCNVSRINITLEVKMLIVMVVNPYAYYLLYCVISTGCNYLI